MSINIYETSVTSLRRYACVIFLLLFICWIQGCSRFPTPPELPKFSAKTATEKAIKTFDLNKNGNLETSEWEQSPTLKAIAQRIDKNEDKVLTSEELMNYMQAWQKSTSFVVAAMPTFYLDDKPLQGAKITLEPAEFLGSSYPQAVAITNEQGTANFRIKDAGFPGVYSGLYKVLVSKQVEGKETIPVKYNVETELGCEFSKENWTTCVSWFPLVSEQKTDVE